VVIFSGAKLYSSLGVPNETIILAVLEPDAAIGMISLKLNVFPELLSAHMRYSIVDDKISPYLNPMGLSFPSDFRY
jgi:hypothetical protein